MTIEKTYMHTGIPVPAKMEGMTYMPGLKVWICNNEDYSIEHAVRVAHGLRDARRLPGRRR